MWAFNTRFLQDASREPRTPLAMIENCAEILVKSLEPLTSGLTDRTCGSRTARSGWLPDVKP